MTREEYSSLKLQQANKEIADLKQCLSSEYHLRLSHINEAKAKDDMLDEMANILKRFWKLSSVGSDLEIEINDLLTKYENSK